MVTLNELIAEGDAIRMEQQEREAKLYREYRSLMSIPEPAKSLSSAEAPWIRPTDPTPRY